MSKDQLIHVERERYPELYPRLIEPTTSITLEDDSIDLLDYWTVLIARRWTILATLVTAVMLALLYTYQQQPIYRASTRIQIDRENPNILNFKDVYVVESTEDDALQTQYNVLKSRTLARRVIEDLRLQESVEFQFEPPGILSAYLQTLSQSVKRFFISEKPPDAKVEAAESDRLRPIIGQYVAGLNVTAVPKSRLADVSYDGKNPELIARIVNAHARHYIEQNLQFKWEATQLASGFLTDQLKNLQSALEKSEDNVQEYSRDNQILFLDEGRNTATARLEQLESEYTRGQADRFLKESNYRMVQAGNLEGLPQVMNNGLIPALATTLAQLRREDSDLATTFNEEYPRRQRLISQIDELDRSIRNEKSRVAKTVEAEYESAKERERLLARSLQEQRETVNRINQGIIQYNILKREVNSNKALYEGLLLRLKEAGISAGLRASNIRIVDQAEVPGSPIRPAKTLNLIISLAVGLFVGVGVAFVQEYLDSSIKTVDDVARNLRVPLLSSVPNHDSVTMRGGYGYLYGGKAQPMNEVVPETKLDLVSQHHPTSVMAEAYRTMRTSLLLLSANRPPKSILITSAMASEGKTVTAINVAISLTQTGAKVALIDSDMRKPRVHQVFGIDTTVGLSSFLSGAVGLKDIIQETSIPNLFIVPCGITPPNPGELIVSNRFKQMMSVLSEYFDYVILDSPPLCLVSDAQVLACSVDATILVVKAFSTSRQMAKHAITQLERSQTQAISLVLNDVDARKKTNYYAYYLRS